MLSMEWIHVPQYRNRIFVVISFVLIMLLPSTGWNPLLILWTVNECLAFKENKQSKIRFFYLTIAIIFVLMIAVNVFMAITHLEIVISHN